MIQRELNKKRFPLAHRYENVFVQPNFTVVTEKRDKVKKVCQLDRQIVRKVGDEKS